MTIQYLRYDYSTKLAPYDGGRPYFPGQSHDGDEPGESLVLKGHGFSRAAEKLKIRVGFSR